MSRRDNRDARCKDCALHLSLCICAYMPSITTASRLCLVMHRDEAHKPTNTGSLAARCLVGSEVLIHGARGERVQAPWLSGDSPDIVGDLLLYPCDEAEPLSPCHLETGPVRLVVPDGTWRQASKMAKRIPWMKDLPRVSLPPGAETSYRLRSEPKEGGLATMEAISRAFAVLEGPEVEAELDEIFRRMIDRTLYSRGQLSRDEVYGGVPDGVQRHKPTL
ncbi:MAG: DTW domain-containing protein [Myxococcales bacterium]|nr:DTW domain-containing protein [Myxococcales bacterium]